MFMSPNVVVDCIFPNTVIVPISCPSRINLRELKDKLWLETKKFPGMKALASPDAYMFVGVTADIKQIEFYDESKLLNELKLTSPVLKVVELQQTTEEMAFRDNLHIIFGQSMPDLKSNEEAAIFKAVLLQIVYSVLHQRNKHGYKSLAYYAHSPNLDPSPYVDPNVHLLLDDGTLNVTVCCLDGTSCTITVDPNTNPDGIIEEAAMSLQIYRTRRQLKRACTEFVLKICGCEEYLLADCPLIQYKTIREVITDFREPQLFLLPRKKMYAELPTYAPAPAPNPPIKRKDSEEITEQISLWHSSMHGNLRVHLKSVRNLQPKSKCFMRAAVYHGDERLSSFVDTDPSTEGSWNDWLEFDISIQQLPRASKLCFSICSVRNTEDKKKRNPNYEVIMHSYGCLNLFDFKGRLVNGNVEVIFQEGTSATEQAMQPLAVYDHQPRKSSFRLTVGFEERFERQVFFPDDEQVCNYGHYVVKLEKKSKRALDDNEIKSIETLSRKDPITELTKEDKEFFWRARLYCSKYPDSLPHLCRSVRWASRDAVSQFYNVLEGFPAVSLPVALELLQSSFADSKVRAHAVASLCQGCSDEELSQFLLQLTFSLKHETYLDSSLGRFLLKKCLSNKNLAQTFFWYLRSECLGSPGCKRTATILQMFCRCLGPDLEEFVARVKVIDKIAHLADIVKDSKIEGSKDPTECLQEILSEDSFFSVLQDIRSPLKQSIPLGKLKLKECKVMDSAKKPLLLVWENADPMASSLCTSHSLIYKGMDDLRQDMLTLQVFGVMSQVWIREGLNLCMTPYGCMVTGNKAGLIEVVQNAKTVFSIQKRAKLGALQVDSSQLLKWIKDHNPGQKFSRAVKTFTRSCAAYCVATFVLGIGDRHPDNIMIHENGQIFHIDFGHFLGNFKKKFGIQRERVPFVLTPDFLKVICAKSEFDKDSSPFQEFQELCSKAYLILRKHTRLLMSLFTLLLSAGIPELQSAKDLEYLRTTLAVGKSEEKALQYFHCRFSEAYGGSWSTKVDWFFHSVKHR